ncbi:Protein of uncharacterised function (DUF2442) [Mycobacteroides abscessus subsp. abscessus]|uniref:DUF2442 domain-containing protein n=1 Tax=Mycobacteroides abscessus TaxID=36809 RepID=UPI00092A797E|nr:DUF2442 domain-containing protein [Mycobacteroides abscessus]SHX68760.1 Protein of uncharacterised function (DUF2442) [Mycobacteroides abscessus subsp. abscessus]SIC57630.1 Protein of uncharacterised function (DUF2442) [Mycobacteroides abscessus subsp. abscessus]SKK19337.1 Protein of uncharacterised function (DUF2442) [Mycobacteroides abscessus subsp. abscessus]SKP48730.1 Protein of uncharacterised function (DUF2442) [Mycobacteroides abscessus subsp. abscessus]
MSSVPWTIVAVEPCDGTVVRLTFADDTVADFDFSYLLNRPGTVFAAFTAETIPAAQLVDGTVAWETPSGTVDLAADALYDHAHGTCPGGSCEGWEPSMTRRVRG